MWNLTHELPIALGMKENNRVRGQVTVIKNLGKPNEEILCYKKDNLLTDAGRTKAHAQIYTNTSAGARGCGFIAVTVNTGAPADGNTVLTGEITAGGLARADASTKSTVTNTTTISHTFTASATHTAVQKAALFDAASAGTMYHINTFTATTLISSDTLTVTWTLTLDD